LITAATEAGADAVKFQKRTVDVVYTAEELARPRESPFGSTNGDLKRGLEFGEEQYDQIDDWCNYQGIDWFASPWDVASVRFLEQYNPPCHKIASACLTDRELLRAVIDTRRPILLSTGMSSLPQIDAAVNLILAHHEQLVILQCVATYPAEDRHLGLRCLETLRNRYDCLVGYSGHERGLATTVAAVALGACVVERHITCDRTSWGSDQSASIEPHALKHLVRDIRAVEEALGNGHKDILPEEQPVAAKLRRVNA
jgi:N-acetylneuraminate synthase